ncbi:MAG TPA: peptide chain release factor 1 [Cryomorphaceae bacterium]|nr:peptide chain release factor 1 [Cryomorphaceae bacterium]
MRESQILEKLAAMETHFREISKSMADPDVIADTSKYIKLSKEYKELEPLVKTYREYLTLLENIENARNILREESDAEFKQMAKEELEAYTAEKDDLELRIKTMLIPKDPEDSKNAIVEIRAGTGGDEASLFAGDLFRMYAKYIESKGWKLELVDTHYGSVGGYKEIIFNVEGEGAYGMLKYEAGVHRVQRIPQTETQGRVHTSAATVIVLPEAEEFDVEIKESDLRVDSYCSSGPGGQSVNTTYSAIRLTHIPTGVVAQCQDQKSKLRNYEKALAVLRTRIYEMELQKKLAADADKRKSMVATGDRSAKIRTYNFPQGRVTDHRINLTMHNLSDVLNGDLHELLDALRTADHADKLKESVES